MVLKEDAMADFLACSGYPECKSTQSLNSNGNGKKIGLSLPPKGLQRRNCRTHLQAGQNLFRLQSFP